MPSRGRKILLSCSIALSIVLLLWQFHTKYRSPPPPPSIEPDKPNEPQPPPPVAELGQHYPPRPSLCQSNLDWLKELDIPFPVKYARREIFVKSNPQAQRNSITKIAEPLFSDFEVVNPHNNGNSSGLAHCTQPLTLNVPAYSKTPPDASHILFGAASTLDRLDASLPFFARWLAHTSAQIIIIISSPDDKQRPDLPRMAALEAHMRNDLSILATLIEPPNPKDSFTNRYFSLVSVLHSHITPNHTRWLAFIDDDTFVTSMPALISALSAYDASQPHYLGALSEEWWTVVLYGLIGMGGGGIFLSTPLAATIAAHTDDCKRTSRMGFGDHKIYECIIRHTDTRLEILRGLYQIDIHGDRSGIFESGRQILTLHHWKEGYWDERGEGPDGIRHPRWFPMDQMSLVTDICERCYLQRWQFGDDTILSNGYSISTYPLGFLAQPHNETRLDQMERTWVTPVVVEGSANDGWDHYVGPLRRKLELEVEKVPWRFLAGVKVDGGVRQYYRHLGKGVEMDSVIELFWIREEDVVGGFG